VLPPFSVQMPLPPPPVAAIVSVLPEAAINTFEPAASVTLSFKPLILFTTEPLTRFEAVIACTA
jgi:hypothetical protein